MISDAVIQLRKLDNLMFEEARHLHDVVDVLHFKHKQYADEIQACIDNHSVDQLEIKRLAGIGSFSLHIARACKIVDFSCNFRPNDF